MLMFYFCIYLDNYIHISNPQNFNWMICIKLKLPCVMKICQFAHNLLEVPSPVAIKWLVDPKIRGLLWYSVWLLGRG